MRSTQTTRIRWTPRTSSSRRDDATCGGSTNTYTAGERPPDVPAGAVHSARMGPSGCRYLIGEK